MFLYIYNKYLLIFIFVFSSLFISVDAKIRITEFLYNAEGNDINKEFIEIINLGPESINITNLKLVIGGKSHNIREGKGSVILHPGVVALITKNVDVFRDTYMFNKNIFNSSFSLRNTENTIGVSLDGNIMHELRYNPDDGGDGNGDSLHVSETGVINSRKPSPGSVLSTVVSLVQTEETEKNIKNSNIKILTSAQNTSANLTITPNPIFNSSDTTFEVFDKKGKGPIYGIWNFGDGSILYGDKVVYQYLYPGDYIIYFEEESINVFEEADVSLQSQISVLTPDIKITRENDHFITLHNGHSFILNLSEWKIVIEERIFTFPKNSFIQGNGSIKLQMFSKKEDSIFFITSGGGQFLGYEYIPQVVERIVKKNSLGKLVTPLISKEIEKKEKKKNITQKEEKNLKKQSRGKFIITWLLLFFGLLALAIAPLFLVESNKKNKKIKIKK